MYGLYVWMILIVLMTIILEPTFLLIIIGVFVGFILYWIICLSIDNRKCRKAEEMGYSPDSAYFDMVKALRRERRRERMRRFLNHFK